MVKLDFNNIPKNYTASTSDQDPIDTAVSEVIKDMGQGGKIDRIEYDKVKFPDTFGVISDVNHHFKYNFSRQVQTQGKINEKTPKTVDVNKDDFGTTAFTVSSIKQRYLYEFDGQVQSLNKPIDIK